MTRKKRNTPLQRWKGFGLSASNRNVRKAIMALTLVFFIFQTVIPPVIWATQKQVTTTADLRQVLPAFPGPMKGISPTGSLRNPHYYIHRLPDPVNALNGNLFLAYQDIFIPARGYPLEISRAYNSRSTVKGIFGYGWSSTLETRITEQADGSLRLTEWDGSTELYRPDRHGPASTGTKQFLMNGSSLRSITRLADGTYIRPVGAGKQEIFSRQGRLLKKEDIYGNGVNYQYDSQGKLLTVADKGGRKLQFTYHPSGAISAAADPMGRKVAYTYDGHGDLLMVVGMVGETTRFAYDPDHNLTEITLPDGGRISQMYDRHKDLIVRQQGPGAKVTVYAYKPSDREDTPQETTVTDGQGNRIVYAYHFTGGAVRKITITDALGRTTAEEYDQGGNLIRRVEPGERTTLYSYTKEGWIQSITDPTGQRWVFDYLEKCSCKRLTRITDPLNQATELSYNDKFGVARITNAKGGATAFRYDRQGDLVEVVGPQGSRTTYQYDTHGYLTGLTGPEKGSVRFIRDAVGRMTELVMPGGQQYRFRYDAKGRLLEVLNPMGYRVDIGYDSMDRVIKIADDEGSFAYTYNVEGSLVQSRDMEGHIRRFEYDQQGQLIRQIDAQNGEWRYTYDRLSRLTQVIDPLQKMTQFAYGPDGLLREVTNPMNARVALSYDRMGRLQEMVDPLGNKSRFGYDAIGQLTSFNDSEGNKIGFAYDATGLLIEATNAIGRKVTYERDSQGNLVKVTDMAGKGTLFRYDKADRVIAKTDPQGNIWTMAYDTSGRLSRWAKPDGKSVSIQYNPLSQPTRIMPAGDDPIVLNYDKKGRLIESSAGAYRYRYRYDRMGSVTAVEDLQRKKTIRHTYDSLYRRVATEVQPDGGKVAYRYDPVGRMTGIESAPDKVSRITYDGAGRRSGLTFPNGISTDYRYDAAGRLEGQKVAKPGGPLLYGAAYTYDRNGLIRSKTDGKGQTVRYIYDSLYRLTDVLYPDGEKENFTYDEMGNLLTAGNETGTTANIYNQAGHLASAGDVRMSYDKNGNLVERTDGRGKSQYRYDTLNRIREISAPNGEKISYAYSPLGERAMVRSGKSENQTLYDGQKPIAHLDASLKTKARIIHGPGFDEVLGQESSGSMQYFHRDPVGSIIAVTDAAGSPVASLSYKAFGTPRPASGTVPALAFAGRPYHPETGLASFPFRDYDPAIGRFLQPEPLGLFAGWENAYAFAMNNPVNFIDPYGLWGWPSISQVVGGIVVAAGVVAAGVAVAAAAPVIAAGGTIGAGIAAAGAALAPVGAAAGAVGTWLGPVGTAAAVAGGAGGAVVSGATAATTGKGFFGTIGDAVIGGVTGAAAGVASTVGGAMIYGATSVGAVASGIAVSMGGGAAAGGVKAVLTGGNIGMNVALGGIASVLGSVAGPIFDGVAAAGIKNFGVGVAQGGVSDLLETIVGAKPTPNPATNAIQNTNCN
jgi:RHS repeat-associated protein